MKTALGSAATWALIWLLASTSSPAIGSEPSRLIAGLEPGPHPVGTTIWHRTDPGRSFTGTPRSGRPLQILLWYPAARDDQGAGMTLRDYLLSADDELGIEPLGKKRGGHLEYVRELALAQGADPAAFEAALARTTLATRDARAAQGPYPVLLLAPGQGAPAFQNLVLGEYLASHGFIVAAIPSIGARSRDAVGDPADLEAYRQDLDFLLTALNDLPAADLTRVGALGYSFGGMAATLLGMQNQELDVLVVHDPGYMVARNRQTLESAPGYAPSRLSQPFLMLVSGAVEARPDLEVVSSLASSDVRAYSLTPLRHGNFASLILELFLYTLPDGRAGGREQIDAGYACVCRSTLAFLAEHLSSGPPVSEARSCSPEIMVAIESRQGGRQEPSRDHWWWLASPTLLLLGALVFLIWRRRRQR